MYDEISEFSEGLAHVISGNQCYYTDKSGNKIIDSNLAGAKFSDGRAINGKSNGGLNVLYGYINKKGSQLIDLQYESVSQFSNGLACAYKKSDTGKITGAYIDINGKEIIPGIFLGAAYSEGYVTCKDKEGGPWVIIKVIKD